MTAPTSWDAHGNLTATGTTKLEKSAGGSDWTNGGAVAPDTFTATNQYLQATRVATGAGYAQIGLDASSTRVNDYTLDYSLIQTGTQVSVYESGTEVFFSNYSQQSVLELRLTATKVAYYIDDVLVYTSTASRPATLYPQINIYSQGQGLENIDLGYRQTFTPSDENNVYGQHASTWPPVVATGTVGDDWFYGAGNNGGAYYTYVRLYRFDTSGLTTNATISAAKFRVYVDAVSVTGTNSGVTGEWYDPGATINSSDWVGMASLSESAWTKVLASAISATAWKPFTLLNPDSNISKSSYTGLRVGSYYDGTPAGNNYIQTQMMSETNKPQLIVTYSVSTPVSLSMGLSVSFGMTINTDRDRNFSLPMTVTFVPGGGASAGDAATTTTVGPIGGLSGLSGMSGLFGGGGGGTQELTAIFEVAQTTGYRYGTLQDATWPPTTLATEGANTIVSYGYDGASAKYVSNCFLRWDTSSIPDSATITSAVVRFCPIDLLQDFGKTLHAEWFDWGGGAVVVGDMEVTPAASVGSVSMASLAINTYSSISMSGYAANVNKSGYTGVRLVINANTDPTTGDDYAQFEFANGKPLQLVVTYTL